MPSLNKAILIGNLTKDPELKKTQADISVCSFSIGVQRKFKTDGKYESDFINIVAWKQTAEFVAKYFTKGKPILIVGSIQTRNYEKDGKKVYVTEVNADEVNFVESKSDSPAIEPAAASEPEKPRSGMQTLGPDDDLPF
jgi:single-strand DNA-binding protein